MSFDVFLQPPVASPAKEEVARVAVERVVKPHVAEVDGAYAHLVTADGACDLYGFDTLGTSVMINHAEGDAIWDLIVAMAKAGGHVIIPGGCATCVVDETLVSVVPDEFPKPIVVVSSGRELVQAFAPDGP